MGQKGTVILPPVRYSRRHVSILARKQPLVGPGLKTNNQLIVRINGTSQTFRQ